MNGEIESENVVKAERAFLHDLSNQLVIAQGMSGFVLSSIRKNETSDSPELRRLEKAVLAIEKMVTMVKKRRELLRMPQ